MIQNILARYRAAFADLPREIWVLALVLLVNRAGAMVLPFLTIYLSEEVGMAEGAAVRMITLYGVGAICGAFASGRATGRFGAMRIQTACLLLTVPGFLLILFAGTPLEVAAAVLYLSFFAEGVRPANATTIAKLAPPVQRTKAFALQRLAANLGFSIGAAVGGVLAEWRFELLFVVDAVTTLLAGVLLLAYFGMRRLPGEVPSAGEHLAVRSPLRDRQFAFFLLLLLATSVVFFQFLATYPLYLRGHYRLTESLIGALFAVNTLLIVAMEMVLVDCVKHWPLLKTIGWGFFLTCLGFGLLPFGSTFAFAVVAMLVLTVGEMLSAPLTAGYVANLSPAGREGAYMGWLAVTMSLAAVLGPAIGSELYAVNHEAVWYASLAVGAAVLAGAYALAGGDSAAAEASA